MNREQILIVGGYGKVGQVISKTLSKLFKNQVVVAGRNYQKARDFSQELDDLVIPMELDIKKFSEDTGKFENVKLVIMCIDQKDTQFVEWCFEQGIDYIDITAGYEFLSKIEVLTDKARKSGTTAILSVGLAPGITNLLAKVCRLRVTDIQFLDIFIMLGMGETHGDEAISWMLDNMNSDFYVMEKGKLRQVGSFIENKRTVFPNETKNRTVYRFNLSDQHVIPKTLSIESASTWTCLDSPEVTWLLYLFRRTGGSKLLNIKVFKTLFLKILKTFSFGSEQFVVKVSAGVNYNEGYVFESSLFGNEEARITGLVTGKVAEHLYTSSFSPGVFHIEELFDPIDFIKSLDGVELKENEINTANSRGIKRIQRKTPIR